MQLKPEKPVYRGLPSGGYAFGNPMSFDTAIVANLDFGCIHQRDACALAKTTVQINA
jgi:hypothetical protein